MYVSNYLLDYNSYSMLCMYIMPKITIKAEN